jgi:hypothetical protein
MENDGPLLLHQKPRFYPEKIVFIPIFHIPEFVLNLESRATKYCHVTKLGRFP